MAADYDSWSREELLHELARLRAEAAEAETLRARESELRALVDAAPPFVVTDERLECRYASPPFLHYAGLRDDQASNTKWLQAVHVDDLARVETALKNPPYEAEVRVRRHDGQYRWCLLRFSPLPASDEPAQWIACLTDVDDLQQAESALKQQSEKLAHQVAELRTDRDAAAAIAATQAEQRERRRLAQVLHDHLQQLLVGASLQITALRDLSRETSLHPRLVRLGEVIAEAIDATRSLTVELCPLQLYEDGFAQTLHWLGRTSYEKHGLRVHVNAEDSANPQSEEVATLLFDAVREMLFNVVKHAGVSEAEVSLERVAEQRVRVTVADLGRGFDPSAQQQAGTGFGLYSIEQRLRLLGGHLQIDAAPGQGTRITIEAPASIPQASATAGAAAASIVPPPAPAAVHEPETPKLRVLLVDDHKLVREGLAGVLQAQPDLTLAAEAADGETAVQLTAHHHPDVVVMDINMPGMNGIEATRILKRDFPDVRVVGVSMHESEQMAQAMYDAGASAYVSKDAPSRELLAAIRGVSVPQSEG